MDDSSFNDKASGMTLIKFAASRKFVFSCWIATGLKILIIGIENILRLLQQPS